MGKTAILDRLLCREAGVTYRELLAQPLGEDARVRLKAAQGRLRQEVLPRLRIVERQALRAEGRLDAALLWGHCCRLRAETGAARLLAVIDYFGLLDVRGKGLTPLEADQRRVEVLQEAAALSRAAGSPDAFLVVSEVRKGDGGRTRLSLDDLLGSARLAYAADAVLLLERDDRPGGASPGRVALSVTVAKGRDGTARERLRLLFEHDLYRFHEPARPAAGGEAARGGPGREVDPLAVGRKE
jgi:replicative DNA helicase